MGGSALMGATTGTMEICKRQQLPVTAANSLSNWVFHFTITGSVYNAANPLRVPVGSCSSPFDVTAGPQTVTELATGNLITPSTAGFPGNFELIDVTNATPLSTSSMGLVNLATRTVAVTMVAGGINEQLTLYFTNRRAIIGYIEICKRAARGAPTWVQGVGNVAGTIPWPAGNQLYNPPPASGNPLGGGDPDVTGFFQYTIEDVYTVNTQNPDEKILQIFVVPVGQCSGPIAVLKGDPAPQPGPPDPRWSLAFVTELARPGFYLENIEVIPASRRNSPDILGFGVGVGPQGQDVLFANAPVQGGGGFVDVQVVEAATSANETLLIFVNRSNPGRVKVCKIAGPGIPINTLFTFTVSGWGATTAANPQSTQYGFVTRTFDVRAGDPAQGGTCEFVPGFGAIGPPIDNWDSHQTFVNGTPVHVYENGISVNNTIPQLPGQLRASRVRVFGSVFTTNPAHHWPAAAGANPDLIPAPAVTSLFSTGNIATPLPDLTTVLIPVNVPSAGLITDVNASIRFTHTFDSDLFIGLLNPANLGVVLSANNGGSGDDYGSGATTCAGTQTVFDDEAGTAIGAGAAPFNGPHRPDGLLSAYDGRGMNGNWRFFVDDSVGGDSGTAHCASLAITQSPWVARASVFARLGVVEVEFTNFRFNPTDLKVCKIAGSPALIGTPFNFTVVLNSPVSQPGNVPLFPAFSQNVTVLAGDPGAPNPQDGNCTFVNGSTLLGGAFNQGSSVTVTEAAAANTALTAITCPSCAPGVPPGLTVDLPGRSGTLSGPNGLVAGINAIVFRNISAQPAAERAVRFDFDGDKKSDASIYRGSGLWAWTATSDNNQMRSTTFGGEAGDRTVAADYDGDGKTDYAIYRPSNGNWYFRGSTNVYQVHQWGGENGDIPQTGDYNGDGKADFIIYRPSNGTWYVKTTTNDFIIFQFGITTDTPLAADYDGDGRTDAAVFRSGTWYIKGSTSGFRVTNFGQNGDVPVPADYDGDGAADLAVYRNGTWFALSATAYTVKQYGGNPGDVPVPADYDGDGKTDLAIFRPSEGRWYIKRSSAAEGLNADDTVNLGQAGDAPVPAQ